MFQLSDILGPQNLQWKYNRFGRFHHLHPRESTCSEELEDVVELAVDISADGDGTPDGLDVGLFEEDFLGFFAEMSKVSFVEALGFPEIGNALVDIHVFSNILKFE